MKIKILTDFILIFLLLFGSCEDFLDEVPKDFLSPSNLPQTEEDCDLMLNGILRKQGDVNVYERDLKFCAGNPGTDFNAPFHDPLGGSTQFDMQNVQPTNTYLTGCWTGLYNIINEVNVMIHKIPETSLDESVKERYIAAAKFLRALYYFHIVRLWGPNAVYLDAPVDDFEAAERMSSVNDIEKLYDLIKSDIEYAVGQHPSGENRLPSEEWPAPGKPTFGAAKALQARIYITMAGNPLNKAEYWQQARDAALHVLDIGHYSLFPTIEGMWLQKNETHAEFIYSIQYDLDVRETGVAAQTRPDEGWHYWYVDTNWIERYFTEEDIRKYEYILWELQVDKYTTIHFTDFWGEPQPYIKKYIDIDRQFFADYNKRTGINWPVFRTSEVYLMIAEAENEVNGPTDLAYQYLNPIRERAGLDPLSGLSKGEFRQEVKNERIRELCFELKNRYDLHRWGDLEEEMSKEIYAAPYFNLEEDEYLPVPDRDAQLNPNLN